MYPISFLLLRRQTAYRRIEIGLDERIRTSSLAHPKRELYQVELHRDENWMRAEKSNLLPCWLMRPESLPVNPQLIGIRGRIRTDT